MDRVQTDTVGTVKAVIVNRGRAAMEKAKELTDIAKCKAQIASCEEVIRKNYLEIGKMVYEAYEEALDQAESAELAEEQTQGTAGTGCQAETQGRASGIWETRYKKQCTAIENARKGIEDLEHRIEELRKKE